MERITKQDARDLAEGLEQELRDFAEMHGLTVEVRGGTFDAGMFKPNLVLKTRDSDEATYNMYREMEGLPEFGSKFKSQGRTFTISGFAPRSTKRPVLAKDESGKTWKFTIEGILRATMQFPQQPLVSPEPGSAPESSDEGPRIYSLIRDGEVLKTSKSKASLQSYRSRTKCGGDIV